MDPNQEPKDQHGPVPHFSPNKSPNPPIDTYRSDYNHQPDIAHVSGPAYHHGHTHQLQPDLTHRPTPQHTLSSQDQDLQLPVVGNRVDPVALHYQDTPTVLPVPHMMALVMSQLQPILEAFNRSLVHMQSQLGTLVLEVAELKDGSSPALQALSKTALEEKEDRLESMSQELKEFQKELQLQLHLWNSQNATLHNNLTKLKIDMDMRAKHQENKLQVSVQTLNLSLAKVKLCQHKELSAAASNTSALWRAVQQLENKVINNSVKVETLAEDVEVTSNSVQQLYRLLKDHEQQINVTSRRSQVHFMETGLEVEAAKVEVMRRVEELAGNLSLQGHKLTELDVDVDYLYTAQNGSSNCGCSELQTTVIRLQTDLNNVTELVNENRLVLEESKMHGGAWGDADWKLVVEALQQKLQQMKWSWASEQYRSRAVERSLVDLSWSLQQCWANVSLLQQAETQQDQDNKHLRSSFNSLLQDVIRHSEVLELLLGEDVLEFLYRPISEQVTYSIPTLKERLRLQEEQLSTHNRSIAMLIEHQPDPEEGIAADQPSPHLGSEWLSGDHSSRGRGPVWELRDNSDLWELERTIKILQRRVHSLERLNHQHSSQDEDQ